MLPLLRCEFTPAEAVDIYLAWFDFEGQTGGRCPSEVLDAIASCKEPEYACMALEHLAREFPACPDFLAALNAFTLVMEQSEFKEYYLRRLVLAYEHIE